MTSRFSSLRTLLTTLSLLAIALLGTTGPSVLAHPTPLGGAKASTLGGGIVTQSPRLSAAHRQAPSTATMLMHYGRLPLAFEPNRGQTASQVQFLAHGPGYTLFLSGSDAVLALPAVAPRYTVHRSPFGLRDWRDWTARTPVPQQREQVVRLHFVGAKAHPTAVGLDRLRGHVSYFIGNDPARWHTNIPTFARVALRNVYPGIDAVYYGHNGRLEYDLVVHPGADVSTVRFRVEGAERLRREPGGDLRLGNMLRLGKPHLYQEVAGSRRAVSGGYVLGSRGFVRIRVGRYDRSASLVIDPTLDYSTYLGIRGSTTAEAIAVDGAGDAYVTGQNMSVVSFPTCPGASRAPGDDECTSTSGSPLQSSSRGGSSAFISELNPSGSELIYSTYLGGTNDQAANAIAVDSSGHAYVTGWTTSGDFPTCPTYSPVTQNPPPGDACATTSGTTLQLHNGNKNFSQNIDVGETGFVAELNPSGTKLVYSTYLGGNGANGSNDMQGDSGNGIAVDAAGDAYVTGLTYSTNFPLKNAIQTQINTTFDTSFVSEINPSGTALIFSTYLGGSSGSSGNAIAVAGTGGVGPACTSQCAVYVAGQTFSPNFPTKNALQSSTHSSCGSGCSGSNAFVSEINPSGSGLAYSTYLGGNTAHGSDWASGIAVDTSGAAYVTGTTGSTNFPTCPGSNRPAGSDPCVSSTGTPLQSAFGGGDFDAFVAKLTPGGAALAYSTYLGGNGSSSLLSPEGGSGIAVDATGAAYVTGATDSTNFPTCPGSNRPAGSDPCTSTTGTPLQSSLQGSNTDDAFVAKLNPSGTKLVYSTYLGGSSDDFGNGIAVDATGATYVTGRTFSTNFPLCPNSPPTPDPCTSSTGTPLQIITSNNGSGNIAFVSKLSAVPDTFIVVGVGDAGTGCAGVPSGDSVNEPSLRCALLDANSDTHANPALIAFDITSGCTANVCTISPATALPALSRSNTTIDGYSQPGAHPNTNTTLALGDNAKILIQLDNATSSGGINLDLTGSNDIVDGLSITASGTGAPTGIAVESGASNDLIAGNYIGLTPAGSGANATTGLGIGVKLNGSTNTVGAAVFQNEPFGGLNVISGARTTGVVVTGSNLTVQDSYIGTDRSGTGRLGNGSGDGIDVTTAAGQIANRGITIGPNAVISGNQGYGLFMCNTTSSTVSGDEIGTNAAGTGAVGNGKGGIDVQGGCEVGASPTQDVSDITIGGTTAAARNIISGNGFSLSSAFGIHLDAFGGLISDVTIEGNNIGTDVNGAEELPNGGPGVQVQSDEQTTNGVTTTWAALANAIGVPGAGNLISGNRGDGISISEVPNTPASDNTIQGNLIGTNAAGTLALGNFGNGVAISTNGDVVGGSNTGDGNVISGNLGAGVLLDNTPALCHIEIGGIGGTFPGNTVGLNRIGTSADGTQRLSNGTNGVDVSGPCNFIGGTEKGPNNTTIGFGNLISGNTGDGVLVSTAATGSAFFNNLIGTNAAGTLAVRNTGFGVDLNHASSIKVGDTGPLEGNTISGNGAGGILVQNGAHDNTFTDNVIGTTISESSALGNNGDGIKVIGSSSESIVANVISGNVGNGVDFVEASNNSLHGNVIGTDRSGTNAIANSTGVLLTSAQHNTIGPGNLISGNLGDGIDLAGASSNTITGNGIGTNLNGTTPLGNRTGVSLSMLNPGTVKAIDSTSNTLSGNLISGNRIDGIDLIDVNNNGVESNHIGTSGNGASALGNTLDGVAIISDGKAPATHNTIGGGLVNGNTISGNGRDGIHLFDAASNTVSSNFIGTDVNGAKAVPNGGNGVTIQSDGKMSATNNVIGGVAFGSRNLISGNAVAGVLILDAGAPPPGVATGNTVQGNFIGTDTTGNTATGSDGKPLGNGVGVVLESDGTAPTLNNVIGGTTPAATNVIGGSVINTIKSPATTSKTSGDGIDIVAANNNTIAGNRIGEGMLGSTLPNAGDGVRLFNKSSGDIIGGTAVGAGNTIAFNTGDGIRVGASSTDPTHVTIRHNQLFNNAGLGIELTGQALANCTSGPTSGAPNDFAPCPVITIATTSQIAGTARAGSTVEVFIATSEADDAGHGEGQTFLGTAVANSSGRWTLNAPYAFPLSNGQRVTATATTAATSTTPAETSEYAANVTVPTVVTGGGLTASVVCNTANTSLPTCTPQPFGCGSACIMVAKVHLTCATADTEAGSCSGGGVAVLARKVLRVSTIDQGAVQLPELCTDSGCPEGGSATYTGQGTYHGSAITYRFDAVDDEQTDIDTLSLTITQPSGDEQTFHWTCHACVEVTGLATSSTTTQSVMTRQRGYRSVPNWR
jgi:parallel beta-helix repeat protein